MKQQGVKVSAKAPAKLKGNLITLPVSGGKEDPTTGKGEVTHEGSIVFSKGNRKVPLRAIELKAKKTPLFAKVGGSQLKVASTKKLSASRAGFGSTYKATGLALTEKVATRLNKKLRTKDFFHQGQAIGSLVSKPQAQRVAILPQGQGTIVPDPAFLAKLKSLFVSLNPMPLKGPCASPVRSNCCSWERDRSSIPNTGSTSPPGAPRPKSTSSRLLPSPASWGDRGVRPRRRGRLL